MTATATPPPLTSRGDEPLLSVRDLRVTFTRRGEESFRAVDGVSLDVRPGQTVGLVGESGCGKSVTSLAIMGLLDDNAKVTGSIVYDGQELIGKTDKQLSLIRGNGMAMVFQDPFASLSPRRTIEQIVGEGLALHQPQLTPQQLRDAVMAAGWATVPGAEAPNRDLAQACIQGLNLDAA